MDFLKQKKRIDVYIQQIYIYKWENKMAIQHEVEFISQNSVYYKVKQDKERKIKTYYSLPSKELMKILVYCYLLQVLEQIQIQIFIKK